MTVRARALAVLVLPWMVGAAYAPENVLLFQDNFMRRAPTLDLLAWTTEFGDASFLGRTQLADWVSGAGQFTVDRNGARLALHTFNPTAPGASFYGTHAKTLTTFQPTSLTAIEFNTRLRRIAVRHNHSVPNHPPCRPV